MYKCIFIILDRRQSNLDSQCFPRDIFRIQNISTGLVGFCRWFIEEFSKEIYFIETLLNLKSWNRKNICQFFRDKMLKLWKRIFLAARSRGQAYSLGDMTPNLTLLFQIHRLHELQLFRIFRIFSDAQLKIEQYLKISWVLFWRSKFDNVFSWAISLNQMNWIFICRLSIVRAASCCVARPLTSDALWDRQLFQIFQMKLNICKHFFEFKMKPNYNIISVMQWRYFWTFLQW